MSTHSEVKSVLQSILGEGSRFYSYWLTSNKFNLVAISDRFETLNTKERESLIVSGLEEQASECEVGLMSLYTSEEADAIGVELPEEDTSSENQPNTWFELMRWTASGKTVQRKPRESTKVVSFYSFKGGVGRTTALVHVAAALAGKGKKVVMIDMDFEAPSLHQAVGKLKREPSKGLVDYLYDRTLLMEGETPQVSVSNIIGEVDVKRGRLFVVPAGRVNMEYIKNVDDLRNMQIHRKQLWETLISEIVDQVEPHLILIDSRTGINIWGALSILTISDDSILFFNPNPQNREGMITILTALRKVGVDPKVVFSPVTRTEEGKNRAREEWKKINEHLRETGIVAAERHEYEEVGKQNDPVMVYYDQGVAMAEQYPYAPAAYMYEEIVDLLENQVDRNELIRIFSQQEKKPVLTSLLYPPEWKNEPLNYFQRTADFERVIDSTTVVIRGKKGTGKTTLYRKFLRRDTWGNWASMLRGVRMVSGYGAEAEAQHPDWSDLADVSAGSSDGQKVWENVWFAYALYRLYLSDRDILIEEPFQPIRKELEKISILGQWGDEHKQFVRTVVASDILTAMVRTALLHYNTRLKAKSETVWLLYDGLEFDGAYGADFEHDVTHGLLSFALLLEQMGIRFLKPKIFLADSLWHRIDVDEEAFVGKEIELKWTKEDLMRLAYRYAIRSAEFKNLVEKFAAVTSDVDDTPEETIEKGLELLWGIEAGEEWHKEKVYETVFRWLSDSNYNAFPSCLIEAIEKAVNYELRGLGEPSSDRLIDLRLLLVALQDVAEVKAQQIREEYKELQELGFFEFLTTIPSTVKTSTLEKWWATHVKQSGVQFESLSKKIETMGLGVRIADEWFFLGIYAFGFRMYTK